MSLKHFSNTPLEHRNSWRTPPEIFAWLNAAHRFDIDLAASTENAFCKKFYSLEDSAFDHDWHLEGRSGFCNPPYDNVVPWIEKGIAEAAKGFTTVLLINSPNGESYYGPLMENSARIQTIIGRLAFIDWEGNPMPGNNRGSTVFTIRGGVLYPLREHHVVYRDQVMRDWAVKKELSFDDLLS